MPGGGLVIEPAPEPQDIQPASIDMRIDLSGGARRPLAGRVVTIDADGISGAEYMHDPCEGGLVLYPGECALVPTLQRVEIPAHLSAEVYGRSSIARLFLTVHQTAGWCDAGFCGRITLELRNESPCAIRIMDRARIAQIKVVRLSTPADSLYGSEGRGSHYQGQHEATPPAQLGEGG